MRKYLLVSLVMVSLVSGCSRRSRTVQGPPQTLLQNISDTIFGTEVKDPYRWLENVADTKVQTWMQAQDRFARNALNRLPGRVALEKRLKQVYYVETITTPVRRKNRYFYTRRPLDKEKAILFWRAGLDGEEKVLIDPNTLSQDGSTSLGVWIPSHDGTKLAYTLRPNNADEAFLHILNVDTGVENAAEVIEGAKYASPVWTPGGEGFYYTWLPTDPSISVHERPGHASVRYHALGTEPSKDPEIHPATGNPQTFINPGLSWDGEWLFISISHGWNSNDLYYRKATDKDEDFAAFRTGIDALSYVIPWKGIFYIFTNEGAPRWKLMKTTPDKLEAEDWETVIPEFADATIENAEIIGDKFVLSLLRNASSELQLRNLDGSLVKQVELPEIGTVATVSGEPDVNEAFFSFESFTRPLEVHRLDLDAGTTSLWKKVSVPIDPSTLATKQVWYPSRDGTKVSMFIIHRKDAKLDGNMRFLLYGYGGFNLSFPPTFASTLYPWLEAGGGYAVANLRGGGEYGEQWHRAGMLTNKQNVFDDFIAAAEYLIGNQYTNPRRLAIRGGSNGGLLVGAAMTQRPDLFRAVVCEVPLLDMVRYHLFGSGRTWVPEYGSSENEEQFRAIYAYSPYHHVVPGVHYPALLMHSADHDDRVDPMHARKMVAAVQRASRSGLPVLMRIETNAGHGGGDMVKKTVAKWTDTWAFLLDQLK